MRFRRETTDEYWQRKKEAEEKRQTWHRHFAWWPVYLEENKNQWVWLETVWRKEELYSSVHVRIRDWIYTKNKDKE